MSVRCSLPRHLGPLLIDSDVEITSASGNQEIIGNGSTVIKVQAGVDVVLSGLSIVGGDAGVGNGGGNPQCR